MNRLPDGNKLYEFIRLQHLFTDLFILLTFQQPLFPFSEQFLFAAVRHQMSPRRTVSWLQVDKFV